MSYLVTGANRGIGLGLVENLLKNQEVQTVIATTRDFANAKDLQSISDPRLQILQLDISCDESVDRFVEKVSSLVGDQGLNFLVNNAAIAVKYDTSIPNRSDLHRQLDVNLLSVILFTQKLLPLLRRAPHPKIVFISSGGGSISLNTWGSGPFGSMAYKVSKAGLNMFVRTVAFDWKEDGILCVALCPGWVLTDLSGPQKELDEETRKKKITVEQSASALVESFSKLDDSHNGGFFDRFLKPIAF